MLAATGKETTMTSSLPPKASMERVTANGGQVVSSVVQIPSGRFAYCLDPDGNSFGLFV
jgi:predicted enzyme related to lactoylglutathione lyase